MEIAFFNAWILNPMLAFIKIKILTVVCWLKMIKIDLVYNLIIKFNTRPPDVKIRKSTILTKDLILIIKLIIDQLYKILLFIILDIRT